MRSDYFTFTASLINWLDLLFAQVVGGNTGGVVAVVEGLNGFIPFSQISMVCFYYLIQN